MKKTTFVFAGIILVGVIGFTLTRWQGQQLPLPESTSQSLPGQTAQTQQSIEDTSAKPAQVRRAAGPGDASANIETHSTPAPAAATPTSAKPFVSPVFKQAIETLVSPQTSYPQRQAAFKQLNDAGQLDQAISELEQRTSANPSVPEYPAVLGQAYLQKAGAIKDIREQGILGLKADQSFEAALQLDPNNWDARFWKATAMSFWPPMLGKGDEVLEHYLTLIQQQEAQIPQPHFAQTYLMLGDQYKKLGRIEHARNVWQRGAGFFPDNQSLKERLVAQ
jgi:hypothetical protein